MYNPEELAQPEDYYYSFKSLAQTEEYWLTNIQNDLYGRVEEFREANGWNRSQLATHLGVSKGYVSQIMNGDFDHKISSLVKLALSVGVVPNLKFQPIAEYLEKFISGYDFCLNESAITATITVAAPTADATHGQRPGRSNTAYHPRDEETFITYQPAYQSASRLELA